MESVRSRFTDTDRHTARPPLSIQRQGKSVVLEILEDEHDMNQSLVGPNREGTKLAEYVRKAVGMGPSTSSSSKL